MHDPHPGTPVATVTFSISTPRTELKKAFMATMVEKNIAYGAKAPNLAKHLQGS